MLGLFPSAFLESAKIGAGAKFPSSLSKSKGVSGGFFGQLRLHQPWSPQLQETVWGCSSSGTWVCGPWWGVGECFVLSGLGLLTWLLSLPFILFKSDCVGKSLVLLIDLWRLLGL